MGAKRSLWSGESCAPLQPGDTVVVPEKAIAGGIQWQSVLLSAGCRVDRHAVHLSLHY